MTEEGIVEAIKVNILDVLNVACKKIYFQTVQENVLKFAVQIFVKKLK